MSLIDDIERVIPEIDIDAAMTYCGDNEDVFALILSDYHDKNLGFVLKAAFMEKDWENYRVQVHSLKSTSLTVGLVQLSEEAKDCEQAIKDGNIDYVLTNHNALMSHYEKVLFDLGTIVF